MLTDLADNVSIPQTKKVNISVTPDILIRMSRGFSCIFWGIPLTLVLFFGTLDVRILPKMHMPGYVLGVLVMYCGVIFLQRVGPLTARWSDRLREVTAILLLEVYLAPFVFWWREMPDVPYYSANILGLFLCAAWGLFAINKLGGEIGRMLHDKVFFVETQISAWLSAALMLAPTGFSLFYSLIAAVLQHEGVFPLRIPQLAIQMPRWVYLMGLLSFSLTMATSWKAKERCIAVLRVSAKVPPLRQFETGGE